MPVSVVVGGQFGSEGKGKVAHWLVRDSGASIAVRVGGPNSGHTALDGGGRPHVFFHLPTAALLDDVHCVLPPGSYLSPARFLEEIRALQLSPTRVHVDPRATLVTDENIEAERSSSLRQSVGSTASGTGAAVTGRIQRAGSARLAGSSAELRPFLRDTAVFLRSALDHGDRVVLEGTQGFGLSLLHSSEYPYVTSRDTTAASVVSEAGLSPLDVDEVVLVLRSFPIRVGGNSGPLPKEIDWDTVTRESGAQQPLLEHTSVTRRVRRVARFDSEIVRQAIRANQPTRLVMNHMDYVDASCRLENRLTGRAEAFLDHVEKEIGRQIELCGVGPGSCVVRPQARSDCRVA